MIQERRLLNPLIIWNGYILDGHSRYRILKHHPEIAFEVKEIQLPDRYAALAWICQNQLGRTNFELTPFFAAIRSQVRFSVNLMWTFCLHEVNFPDSSCSR